jgi:hypothetical protein
MPYLFNQKDAQVELNNFFSSNGSLLTSFGNTVNQTFEAFVFASCIKWYKNRSWDVKIINPEQGRYKNKFQLKFNTRGAPAHYSYARCVKNNIIRQIHHGLRVNTHYSSYEIDKFRANICLDIAIIKETDITCFKTDIAIPNSQLLSFGEAKHMSAFAELIASFIGMVHELLPKSLDPTNEVEDDILPFLYVSGRLNPTAKGMYETIKNRNIKINIYSFDYKMNQ